MRITQQKVAEEVAAYTGIPVEDMIRRTRKIEIVLARQCAMYLIYDLVPAASVTAIGKFFQRDHTTVLHAKQHICDIMYLDGVREIIDHVTLKIGKRKPVANAQVEVKRLQLQIEHLKTTIRKIRAKNYRLKLKYQQPSQLKHNRA